MPHRDIVHHASGNPGYKLSIVSSYWDGKGILSLEAARRRLTCTAIEHDSILFLHLVSLSYLSIAKGSDLKRETAAGKASARAFVFLEGTICLTALKNYSNLKHITGDWCEWRSCFPDWCSGLNWMHCDFFTISLTLVFFFYELYTEHDLFLCILTRCKQISWVSIFGVLKMQFLRETFAI